MINRLYLSFYSPVHIGDGGELEPFEYVVKDNCLCTFSFETFVAALNAEDRGKLLALQRSLKPSALKDIRNFIRHRITPAAFKDRIPVTPAVAEIYKERFLDMRNMLKVEPFIKTMGSPYIPGSSLKGCIRTAVLNFWADSDGKSYRDEHDILKAKKEDRKGRPRPDIGLDVFKYLKVPDVPLPRDFTFFSKMSNFNIKDNVLRETKIQMLREVTRSVVYPVQDFGDGENRFAFDLRIDEEIMADRKAVVGRRDLTFEVVWKSLDFYEGLLKREAEKWSAYNGNLKRFYEGFARYLQDRRKVGGEGSVKVIKVGFGSGFEAVTVERIRKPRLPHGKSLNLFEGIAPPGWVVLSRE
jgi:CRISPR-associated protein Csm5